MPVIQCPTCQRKLNLKQMPAASRIKCPGCSNPITLPKGSPRSASPSATPSAGATRSAGLTPEDEGFDFGQVQFPSAGPAAVSTFQTGGQSLDVYQGPIPGDPLGDEQDNASGDDTPVPDAMATAKKPAGKLSPVAIAGILGGTVVLLLIAIVVATMFSGGDSSDEGTPKAAATSNSAGG